MPDEAKKAAELRARISKLLAELYALTGELPTMRDLVGDLGHDDLVGFDNWDQFGRAKGLTENAIGKFWNHLFRLQEFLERAGAPLVVLGPDLEPYKTQDWPSRRTMRISKLSLQFALPYLHPSCARAHGPEAHTLYQEWVSQL